MGGKNKLLTILARKLLPKRFQFSCIVEESKIITNGEGSWPHSRNQTEAVARGSNNDIVKSTSQQIKTAIAINRRRTRTQIHNTTPAAESCRLDHHSGSRTKTTIGRFKRTEVRTFGARLNRLGRFSYPEYRSRVSVVWKRTLHTAEQILATVICFALQCSYEPLPCLLVKFCTASPPNKQQVGNSAGGEPLNKTSCFCQSISVSVGLSL